VELADPPPLGTKQPRIDLDNGKVRVVRRTTTQTMVS
jgi:hypothetical protein